jgi:hypothetical protein
MMNYAPLLSLKKRELRNYLISLQKSKSIPSPSFSKGREENISVLNVDGTKQF